MAGVSEGTLKISMLSITSPSVNMFVILFRRYDKEGTDQTLHIFHHVTDVTCIWSPRRGWKLGISINVIFGVRTVIL